MKTPEQMKERTLELLEQAKANLKPSREKISEEEMQNITRFISERIFPFRKMERLGHPNRPKESNINNINKLRKRNPNEVKLWYDGFIQAQGTFALLQHKKKELINRGVTPSKFRITY